MVSENSHQHIKDKLVLDEYMSVGFKKMLIREYKTKIDIQLHGMLYAQRKFEIAVVIFFEFRVRFLLYFFLSEIVHDLWKKKEITFYH